jgi:hypothetical protein
MFLKTKNVYSSIIDRMKFEAMKSEDYSTVSKLLDAEAEMDRKLFYERLRGMVNGYGTALVGVTIGTVVLKNIKK